MSKITLPPRGIRMNNPGNIKELPGDKTQWQGERATDDDPVFEEFATPEAGIRALVRILAGYQQRHGLNTVAGIINRWAPSFENDTGTYAAHVAARLIPTAISVDLWPLAAAIEAAAKGADAPARRGNIQRSMKLAVGIGVTPDQPMDVTRPETMMSLVEAIIQHENGQQPYSRAVIQAGVTMGLARA
jgi:hypothetical protein